MKEGYVVPTIEKIAYGLGDLAINIAYTTIGFYFLFFFSQCCRLTCAVGWHYLFYCSCMGCHNGSAHGYDF
ncbi:MAG TPA: hypothetical protein PLV81_01610 [Spirochaetota bacterium]|nr:hypothetical protein [Spirochaetota bacterium]